MSGKLEFSSTFMLDNWMESVWDVFFWGGFWKVLSVATANVREKITWEELLAPCIKAVTHLKSAGLFACVCIALPCV